MNVEKYSDQLDELLTFYPFTKYDNRYFTNNPPFLKDPAGRLEAIKNFDSYESDVIVASCLKAGTHWVHEIVSMLLTHDTTYNRGGLIMDRNFEALLDLDKAKDIPQPRLFHTHMNFKYLPRKHIDNAYKIVLVNRNPKAKHVSMYNFMVGKTGVPDWTWSDFFELFVMGKGDLYDGWFQYTKEWEDAKKTHPDCIHSVHFEWLKEDPFGTTKNLAEFLKVPYTDDFIKEIIDKCAFDNLKEYKIDASRCIHPEGKSTLYRKGEVDDWKNWFTVAQNERFDELYATEMAGYDLKF